ncbi:TEF18 [Auxenochlorella protothecoides x Auxenochlorella symbiontica]
MQRLRAIGRLARQARSALDVTPGIDLVAIGGSRPLATACAGTAATAARSSKGAAAAALLVGSAASMYFAMPAHARDESTAAIKAPSPADPPLDVYSLPKTPLPLPESIVLYQYEVCPFCCKVKAFLDYHKIPYTCVEVNPLTKAELKWSEYKKVPVVVMDGEQFNDSSAIISRLSASVGRGAATPDPAAPGGWRSWLGQGSAPTSSPPARNGTQGSSDEETWRRWVDSRFVRVITVNIYRNARESWQTFDYIAEHGNFGWVQREAARVAGAGMMWALSGRLKKKYGIDGDSRKELYADAEYWVRGLQGRTFHGGDAPDLADLAVFGVIRAVAGTDTFNDLMHGTKIGTWYEAMFKAVGGSARRPA